MKLRPPGFWFRPAGWQTELLWPAAELYGRVATQRLREAPRREAGAPTLCIGNFTMGGGGKTPTALALAAAAKAAGHHPGFLTRGHGGQARIPLLVDRERHGARLVGDEPLLLADKAPTAVSPDRWAGTMLLRHAGCDLFLMDDGFQSAQLRADLSLLVVDGARGLGNARTFPAGPLRAPLHAQWPLADALLLVGEGEAGREVAARAERDGKPVHRARLVAEEEGFYGLRCLAFSGIADPLKFHRSLAETGAEIAGTRDFPDHHPFTEEDAAALLREADAKDLVPVTTAKDHVRLLDGGPAARELAGRARVLAVALRFDDEGAPGRILAACLAAYEARAPASSSRWSEAAGSA
ncbi:tetraacyldisaccharide 4'-kinase [Aureimonas sp. ME7]|uniref:tetraacyldisaccharide 4'-kinase n=1 Tax=Aureimonas sp. ME7 TaxID=2744252 RepID=UPI0015F3FBD4|nr:tetraacyldisaccharide 4'-kinase [Aureimonas sp. ME7]